MPVGVELAAHLRRALARDRAGGAALVLARAGALRAISASTSAPRSLPDLDEEAVRALVEQLGQRQVEAGVALRARCPSRRRSRCRRPGRS